MAKTKSAANNTIAITILGSGTCVPSLRRSSCSVLMESGSEKLLFDCGAGTMRRLLEAGTTIFDVSYIVFSHFHPDHSGELASFLFSSKYPARDSRKRPLTIISGKGFADFYNGLKRGFGHWIELEPGLLHIVELNNTARDTYACEAFTLESAPVQHNDESIAYRLTGPGGISVVYSGDTDFSDALITLADNADLLICEAALPDECKVEGHLTPSLAGTIAARANVRKLVLTHFYPECDQSDIEKQCRKTYAGPLVLAEDLMKIQV